MSNHYFLSGKQRKDVDDTTMTTAILATLKSDERGICDEGVFHVPPSTAPHPRIDREDYRGEDFPAESAVALEERREDHEKDRQYQLTTRASGEWNELQSPNRKSPTGGSDWR